MAVHHRDRPNLRAGDARAVMRIAPGDVAATGMSGVFEHHVYEGAAPQAAAASRVGADITARFFDQRIAGKAGIGRIGMRLRRFMGRQPAVVSAGFLREHARHGRQAAS